MKNFTNESPYFVIIIEHDDAFKNAAADFAKLNNK